MSNVPPWEEAQHDATGPTFDPRETTTSSRSVDDGVGPQSATPVHPPVRFLVYAGAAVLLAALVLFLGGNAWHICGYLLGTIVTIGAVTLFRREDVKRRGSRAYAPREHLALLATTIVVVGFGLAVIHVWFLADDLARR